MNTPGSNNDKAEVPDGVRKRLAELRMLHDAIRLELNFAGEEARERWLRLEAQVWAAEADVHAARGEGARSLAKLVAEVRRFRNRLLERVAPISRIC